MATRSTGPYAGVVRAQNRGTEPDIHGMMNMELRRQGQTQDSSYTMQQDGDNSTPKAVGLGFVDEYVYLSSANVDQTSRFGEGELKYSIAGINNKISIQNCIGIRIYPFYFPNVTTSPSQPDLFFFSRMFVRMDSLPVSAVLGGGGGGGSAGSESSRHHFELEVENPSGIAVRLTPISKEGEGGVFYFQKPVNQIDQLSFFFSVPTGSVGGDGFRPVPIPRQTLAVQTVPGTNPARFIVLGTDTTAQIGPIGVPLAPGIAVFPKLIVNSGNSVVDAQVNDDLGQFVTNIINATTFEVANLDFTIPPFNATAYNASLLIGKNRIAFRVQFISTRTRNTNFMGISHK